jgi:hypothetical protein
MAAQREEASHQCGLHSRHYLLLLLRAVVFALALLLGLGFALLILLAFFFGIGVAFLADFALPAALRLFGDERTTSRERGALAGLGAEGGGGAGGGGTEAAGVSSCLGAEGGAETDC